MRPKNRRGKRHQGWQEEEPEIDDLAVAASFAQATTLPPKQPPPQEQEPAASDRDNDQNEDETQESSENQDKFSNNSDSSDDDDGESDIDLSEALADMEDNEEIDGDADLPRSSTKNKNEADSQAPTTENELDSYRTPISDLETKFQLNLTVAEQERLRLDKEMDALPSGGPVQLCAAGHVKCHMVQDRTIVVESVSNGRSSFAALDEGSLLVIRVQGETKKSRLISLGKIFEVFGPVSKPLYTIRLSLPKDEKATTKPAAKDSNVNASIDRDADEISLDDGESDEQEEDKAGENTADASPVAKDSPSVAHKDSTTDDADPWATDGKYTKLLKSTERMPVYYISDIAKLLDTGAVIRNSGRGCDASNLYDEEVINAKDMDFSDDEQEREYKNRNKSGKKGRRNNNDRMTSKSGRSQASSDSGYTGFHAPQHTMYPPTQPVQYRMPAAYQPMPYQPVPSAYPDQPSYPYPQQPQYSQGAPGYSYASHPYPPGTIPPPPPPPPPQYPYPTYPTNPEQGAAGYPEEESSDTVYYD